MTSTLSCAHKSCYAWCFPLTVQINHPKEEPSLSHILALLICSFTHHATSYFQQLSLIFSLFTFLQLHPSAHCVTSLLCESELFVWRPKCNATPLTRESQQSVVLVRETCLDAAVLSFSQSKWALWQCWKPKKELAFLQLHVFFAAEEHGHPDAGFKCLNTKKQCNFNVPPTHWVLAGCSAFSVVGPSCFVATRWPVLSGIVDTCSS